MDVDRDLDDWADRARVYEQVLREGSEDEVRFYIEVDKLRELFGELVLPPLVLTSEPSKPTPPASV